MIKEAIIKLSKKQDLAYAEAEAVMDEIMSGQATPVQMSAYLTALALKGETIDEITASAAGMRAHCIKLLHNLDVLEIVGTGGDGSNSFNISTTSSLVIAAGGVPVAKHGNRAASSKSGAADVLETLGVKITLTDVYKRQVEATVKETVEATVQKAIEPLQQDICDLKEEVNGVKLHLENVTDRNISILAENHGYLVKKFNEAVEAAHNNHVNTVQTSYLIEHVANLENRMQAVEKNMTL